MAIVFVPDEYVDQITLLCGLPSTRHIVDGQTILVVKPPMEKTFQSLIDTLIAGGHYADEDAVRAKAKELKIKSYTAANHDAIYESLWRAAV